MSYLGVDVGTTGCKAVAFDDAGRQIASAYREYNLIFDYPGGAELDCNLVLKSCRDVIRSVAAETSTNPIRSLAISALGEAFTVVDSAGQPLRHAMVSMDSRASALTQPFSDRFGKETLYRITGHTPYLMYTLFKVLWIRENEPDIWRRTAKVYCFEELLTARLGVEPAISQSMACRMMLYDVAGCDWSDRILNEIGLRRDQLARVLPSGAIIGVIPTNIARDYGLPDGVRVVCGGHDQPCAALGAGVTSPGKAMYATGTVECVCPAFSELRLSDDLMRNNLCAYHYTLPDMFTTVAFSLTGGNILKWYRDQFGQLECADASARGVSPYDVILSRLPEPPSPLMVLPYFAPSGTPYFDSQTEGAIVGLRLTSTREEILKALLEGVAFEIRLNIEILRQSDCAIDHFIATGGGSKSLALTQLKADIIGRPISVSPVSEAGCLGCAILSRAAIENAPAADVASAMVKTGQRIEPNADRAKRYDERYDAYKRLYPAIKSINR